MTALARFSAAAQGKVKVEQHSILPDTHSPGVAVTALFPYQSYYSDALLEKALLQQSANQPIIDTPVTPAQIIQIGGYGLALHPSSQTPVAVQPIVGGQPSSAQAIVLRPGQIYRPHGRPWGRSGNFSGFFWGVPFGWLGGGLATLYVFPSPDADAAWPGDAEVIFQRQRMQITVPAEVAAKGTAPYNWPLRFPWPHAKRNLTIDQSGSPTIAIAHPTKTLMSLRLGALANPATMRFDIQASNDFDLDSAMAPIATPVRFLEYVWGSYAASGAGGSFATEYPIVEAPSELTRLAADDGGIRLIDMSGGSLDGAYVDFVRYGKI